MCTVTAHAFSPILPLSMILVGVCLRAGPADPAARSHPPTCPSGRWRVPGTTSPSPWWAHPWGTLSTARAHTPCGTFVSLCLDASPPRARRADVRRTPRGARIPHRPHDERTRVAAPQGGSCALASRQRTAHSPGCLRARRRANNLMIVETQSAMMSFIRMRHKKRAQSPTWRRDTTMKTVSKALVWITMLVVATSVCAQTPTRTQAGASPRLLTPQNAVLVLIEVVSLDSVYERATT